MGLADLSRILWQQRELMELLLFKLEEQQLLLVAGRSRWMGLAAREIEHVLDRIRDFEGLRAVELEPTRRELGLTDPPTLLQLAELTGEPWSELFTSHREHLLALTAEVQALTEANRELLAAGSRAVADTLLNLTDPPNTYDASGRRGGATHDRAHLVDRAV
jgi:hypothetical protein